jgi:hypothetical protein
MSAIRTFNVEAGLKKSGLWVKSGCKKGLQDRRRVLSSRQELLDSALVQVAVQV